MALQSRQFAFIQHRKRGEGLLRLVMAKGPISRERARETDRGGEWEVKNEEQNITANAKEEDWPICSRPSTILISVQCLEDFPFLFTLVGSDVFFLLNYVSKWLTPRLLFLLSESKANWLMTYLLNFYYMIWLGFPRHPTITASTSSLAVCKG